MNSLLRCLLTILIVLGPLCSRSGFGGPDSYRFRLHKFEQPIGVETDSISNAGGTLQIESAFEFTDRGTKVPLKATLRCSHDYTPSSFTISGSTSRMSTLDVGIAVTGHSAKLRDGKSSREAAVPQRFFTIAGYAPAALQEALVRYWQKHGKPAQLAILPSGTVEIAARGRDIFTIGGERVRFRRYSVRGLVWGLETLWMDDSDGLAAVVTRDAEFDHFEAVREGYEPALAGFISAGARDEIANLAQLNKELAGRQTGALAITGATLIDGVGGAPISPATVVTRDGRIVAAGPGGSVAIPGDAKRIDATGKYIIPGLWDMHAHYEQVEWGAIYLAAGITTVRDVGNEFVFITAIRDANNSGSGLGPRLLLAGLVDGDGPAALGMQRVNSAGDAAAWVKRYHDAGFQQMKIYSSVKPEVVKTVCEDAHALGMTVTGHIPRGMSLLDGVAAGMDQVNHISYVTEAFMPKNFDMRKASPSERMNALKSIDPSSEAAQRVIAVLKDHGTVIDDTAALFELGTRAADQPATAMEPGIANVAPELQEQFKNGGVPAERLALVKLRWSKTLEIMGALHRAGIRFVAGTDQAVPGYSVYREIEIYVEAGFTPLEALQAATIVPARVMKVDSDSGSVETGKRADFDILDSNPLDDIHNIRSLRWVVANGTLYDPKPLWRAVGFKPPG
ncbi:MAG: amidohydrolase family protein [Bryobacteraceae bacterium]